MENVRISKICGLCGGCKFAVNETLKELGKHDKVTLFKEIVHNKNVNAMLQNAGVCIENELENLVIAGFVVVRAHGEPPSTFKFLKENNIPYLDCTCVNVKNIHKQIEEFSKKGFTILIIGKYGKFSNIPHPEILGSIGYCLNPPILIEDMDDLEKLKNIKNKKVYVTIQTTFNEKKANDIISSIKKIAEKNNIDIYIENSICSAQKSINFYSKQLANDCDIMIVVGGKNSSNTKELYENLKQTTKTIFLENIYDWENAFSENNIILTHDIKIGITAGASTMKEELETLKNLIQNKIDNGEKI